jgi:sulfate permease, SulP family
LVACRGSQPALASAMTNDRTNPAQRVTIRLTGQHLIPKTGGIKRQIRDTRVSLRGNIGPQKWGFMDRETGLETAAMARRHEFTPMLVSSLRDGYTGAEFRNDMTAGLTVAVVALPLSMAIAIASGLAPEKGLIAAIIGGIIISALGGCRFQVGGPAGAFIVLIATIVEKRGYDGLLLAMMMAGVLMIVIGGLRLGAIVQHVPDAVLTGFTTGIAVIIGASQIKDLLGLDIAKEPSGLILKFKAIVASAGSIKPATVALSAFAIAVILACRHWRPKWPAFLVGVVTATAASLAMSKLMDVNVATIGSRFGGIPNSLPWPTLPVFTAASVSAALFDAIAIAMLGAIESLLSAVVADNMSNDRHRSSMELVAQGLANIATAAFAGMVVTGTIARTATNIRAGAHGPVAGMLHAVFVLAFVLLAAPVAKYIPLAGLAAILAVVCWGMAEGPAFWAMLRSKGPHALVLAVTFLLTIFVDLIIGIAGGCALAFAVGWWRQRDVTWR